jgi:hypothetical protein
VGPTLDYLVCATSYSLVDVRCLTHRETKVGSGCIRRQLVAYIATGGDRCRCSHWRADGQTDKGPVLAYRVAPGSKNFQHRAAETHWSPYSVAFVPIERRC